MLRSTGARSGLANMQWKGEWEIWQVDFKKKAQKERSDSSITQGTLLKGEKYWKFSELRSGEL